MSNKRDFPPQKWPFSAPKMAIFTRHLGLSKVSFSAKTSVTFAIKIPTENVPRIPRLLETGTWTFFTGRKARLLVTVENRSWECSAENILQKLLGEPPPSKVGPFSPCKTGTTGKHLHFFHPTPKAGPVVFNSSVLSHPNALGCDTPQLQFPVNLLTVLLWPHCHSS